MLFTNMEYMDTCKCESWKFIFVIVLLFGSIDSFCHIFFFYSIDSKLCVELFDSNGNNIRDHLQTIGMARKPSDSTSQISFNTSLPLMQNTSNLRLVSSRRSY